MKPPRGGCAGEEAGNVYGVLETNFQIGSASLGLFQVKRGWADRADPLLIAFSAGMLLRILREGRCGRVAMNYPGIGNGRLEESVVEPILRPLPDCVRVYKRG